MADIYPDYPYDDRPTIVGGTPEAEPAAEPGTASADPSTSGTASAGDPDSRAASAGESHE